MIEAIAILAILGAVALVLLGTVGPVAAADGTLNAVGTNFVPFRHGKTGEIIHGDAHGKYYEATSRGVVFAGQTAATGVAPGTALGTTAAFCLHNPAGSGKRLSINRLWMGLVSGTMGAGYVNICSSNSGDVVPTGTAIVPRNRAAGNVNASIALPFTTATITTNAGKQIGVLCSLSEEVVATATGPTEVTEKEIAGEITIEPGFNITLHATAAAGSSPLVVFGASWEEIPIV